MTKNVTLLYVDDEHINRVLFEINFSRKYNVITAESGPEGLEKLHGNTDIIVVVSDMKMPDMTGVEFIQKARETFPHIAYFILTGFDINEDISNALNQKMIHEYFRKPFNMKEIDAAIEKAIAAL